VQRAFTRFAGREQLVKPAVPQAAVARFDPVAPYAYVAQLAEAAASNPAMCWFESSRTHPSVHKEPSSSTSFETSGTTMPSIDPLYDSIQLLENRHGVPRAGWVTPPPAKRATAFTPTPEIVRGVTVSSPFTVLRDAF
jgi:hypothetical protein